MKIAIKNKRKVHFVDKVHKTVIYQRLRKKTVDVRSTVTISLLLINLFGN